MLTNGAISTATFGTYYHLRERGTSFEVACVASGVLAGLCAGPAELVKVRRQLGVRTPLRPLLGTGLAVVREVASTVVGAVRMGRLDNARFNSFATLKTFSATCRNKDDKEVSCGECFRDSCTARNWGKSWNEGCALM
jgi:hypothetical protein